MRLSKQFGIIAAILSLAVVALVAVPVVYGQTMKVKAERQDRPMVADPERSIEILGLGGARLGVSVKDLATGDVAKLKLSSPHGVAVEDVSEGSPAAKAGLKAGDVIVQFDGEHVRSASQFVRLVRETPVGRAVKIGVMRGGQRMDVDATLTEADRMSWMGDQVRPQIERNVQREMDALRDNQQENRRQPMPPDGRMRRFYFQTPRSFDLGPMPGRVRLGVDGAGPDAGPGQLLRGQGRRAGGQRAGRQSSGQGRHQGWRRDHVGG